MFELAFPGREPKTENWGRSSEEDAFPGRTIADDDDDFGEEIDLEDDEDRDEELVSDSESEDPVLTEEDLEENELTDEEADDIDWDEPQR